MDRWRKGLALVWLLLAAVYAALKWIPAKQLEKLWTGQQADRISSVLGWCVIGGAVLLAAILLFNVFVSRGKGKSDSAAAAVLETGEKLVIGLSTELSQPIAAAETAGAGQGEYAVKAAFHLMAGSAQHIGEREEQQDAYCFSSLEDAEAVKRHGVLAVLADGMGGYEMGREAGRLAALTMLDEYTKKTAEEAVPRALAESLQLANKAVYELALEHELEWCVGTTLAAAVIQDNRLFWISAGDSRIYWYRGGKLIALTKDHIYANRLQERVAAGELTQEEADSHPERHLLTSYLGIPRVTEMNANQVPIRLMAGDWVILCSDGLYDDLSVELLEEAKCFPPNEASAYIVKRVLAQERPYQDNATIAILACY
ncbi:protein phosphatase 2C domain-containing protein [Paenibacillus sp. LHD-38]|uniref:PP2C family protein-serine/threonine phosphatase n=1 Tax=Paenibacillus sp. LHD-38 TaxID=3072143 RepID=UPI00280DE64D|nr:protein phosphatase 2C domain-containing protein [Paenibacillus sp. LHD-38]MDQ8734182.1 protein phosphatase 2C domain-containing protein [Paenibacillus sp. LHD-38]